MSAYGEGNFSYGYDSVPVFDAQANTNALMDSVGNVQARYQYTAFGSVAAVQIEGDAWSTLSIDQWAGMTTQQWADLPVDLQPTNLTGMGGQRQYFLDTETNLLLMGGGNADRGGRFYRDGRFISDDPIRHASGDDNLQRYGGNNPISNQDPSGHITQAQLQQLQDDRPAQVEFTDGFSWDVAPPVEDKLPKKGDRRVISLPNGLTYYGEITSVSIDSDTAYVRQLWGGLPTTYTLTYKETFTRKGSGYAEQAESNYRDGVKEYQDAVEQLHETGKELGDFVASFNPLVNIVTATTGKDASNEKVSGGDRAIAAANVIPGEAIFASALALFSALKKLRAARTLKIIDLVYRVEHAADEAAKLKALENLQKAVPTPEMEAEARRLYSIALDPKSNELSHEGIKAAIESAENTKPPVIGEVRPYNEAKTNRYSGYDDHHLDPPLGRTDPNYKTGPTIPVRNDNAGGKIAGGVNIHTGPGGFQQALNQHIKDLGFTRQQWNALPEATRMTHLRRYYSSLGIPFPG